MTKTSMTVFITAALFVAGAWKTLRGGECQDWPVACDFTETDGGFSKSAHQETITVRGGQEPDPKTLGSLTGGPCRVAGKPSAVYACAIVGASITQYPEASQPASGCACSDGSPGCECLDTLSGKWAPCAKGPTTLAAGRWRGTCVALPACEETEELISGVGAVNVRGYLADKRCNGAGKVPPPLPSALKAAQAEVIK